MARGSHVLAPPTTLARVPLGLGLRAALAGRPLFFLLPAEGMAPSVGGLPELPPPRPGPGCSFGGRFRLAPFGGTPAQPPTAHQCHTQQQQLTVYDTQQQQQLTVYATHSSNS